MVVATTFALSMATILGLSDSLLAGIFIGENGIAAINLVSPLFLLGTFLSGLVSIGSGFVFSKAIGAFDEKRAGRIFSMSLAMSVVVGLLTGIVMFAFENLYFDSVGVSEDIRKLASEYYFWIMFANIIYPISMVVSEFVTNEGDEFITSLSYFVQIIGNLVLSIFLCKIMGIAGIGLGTFIGCILSISVNSLHLLKKDNNLHFVSGFDKGDLKEMLLFSMADSFLYLFIAITDYVLNLYVVRNFGEASLPVLGIAMFVIQFTISFDGIGTAFSPLINVYLGEENYKVCGDFMKHIMKVAIIEGIVVMLIFLLGAPLVVKIFSIDNAATFSASVMAVRIAAFIMPAAAVLISMVSLYNICGHVFVTTIIEGAQQMVLPIVFSIIGGSLFGINGIWIGYVLAFYVTIVVGYVTLCRVWGKEKAPWFLPENDYYMQSFHIALTQDEVMGLIGELETILEEKEVSMKSSMKIQLFTEELGMTLVEHNKDKEILSEWTISINEDVRLIVRYGGEAIDLTKESEEIDDSYRAMFLSRLMNAQEDKRYLMSTGLNRCAFVFSK